MTFLQKPTRRFSDGASAFSHQMSIGNLQALVSRRRGRCAALCAEVDRVHLSSKTSLSSASVNVCGVGPAVVSRQGHVRRRRGLRRGARLLSEAILSFGHSRAERQAALAAILVLESVALMWVSSLESVEHSTSRKLFGFCLVSGNHRPCPFKRETTLVPEFFPGEPIVFPVPAERIGRCPSWSGYTSQNDRCQKGPVPLARLPSITLHRSRS